MGWPSQFEELWPIDAQGAYVVLNDDRLVVMTIPPSTPDGDPQTVILFDGFAQIPQVDLSAQRQAVTFVASGPPIRLWDSPITAASSATLRRRDDRRSSDVAVHLPAGSIRPTRRSAGRAATSATASDAVIHRVDATNFPVFLDPLVVERRRGRSTFWYVSDAMAYLIANEPSPQDDGGNPFVIYPTLSSLKDLLSSYSPPDGKLLNPGDARRPIS